MKLTINRNKAKLKKFFSKLWSNLYFKYLNIKNNNKIFYKKIYISFFLKLKYILFIIISKKKD